jgi:hypothetical protein
MGGSITWQGSCVLEWAFVCSIESTNIFDRPEPPEFVPGVDALTPVAITNANPIA